MYWLSYCVASCNRYLTLINHPTYPVYTLVNNQHIDTDVSTLVNMFSIYTDDPGQLIHTCHHNKIIIYLLYIGQHIHTGQQHTVCGQHIQLSTQVNTQQVYPGPQACHWQSATWFGSPFVNTEQPSNWFDSFQRFGSPLVNTEQSALGLVVLS